MGGDEASSERSAISRENCTNQRRESVASRSVPDDNWLLGFPRRSTLPPNSVLPIWLKTAPSRVSH